MRHLLLSPSLLLLAACFGMPAQDVAATNTEEQLTRAAFCHLDGGATRALIHAAHDEAVGILRRNGNPGIDGGITCP